MTQIRSALVIPVYNQAEYLAETIRSALAQRRPFDEIIVVDDGSSDGSGEVARGFGQQVRLIGQANAGQAAALNAGWAATDADVIGYLSSDDLIDATLTERLLPLFEAAGGPLVAYPRFRLINGNGHPIGNHVPVSAGIADMARRFRCDIGVGALFSSEIVRRAGGWDTTLRLMPDFEFWLRAASIARFAAVPDTLAAWRIHDRSQTNNPTSADKAEEPLRIAARVRAQPRNYLEGLDPAAFEASAHLVAACKHFQSGRLPRGVRRLAGAIGRSPSQALNPGAVGRVAISAARGMLNVVTGRA